MTTSVPTHADYVLAEISAEHFIPEHTFTYIIEGIMRCYDGSKTYIFRTGNGGIARKNHLARYKKEKEDGQLEKVFVFFDEKFLRTFQEKHNARAVRFTSAETFARINTTELLVNFIYSFLPYYHGGGNIDPKFADVKKEELLLILLQTQPELAGIFFDFEKPAKINLEAFMNRNYQFNVSLERFAYLTGRSLSAFKRDFNEIFNSTPSRWLEQKRLQEAYFLIDSKHNKPSDIYLDLGFETLSHFSFAFKKQFGVTPSALINNDDN